MKPVLYFLVSLLYLTEAQVEYEFPSDFQFGVATASYQVEGAWNVDGKGENIWDYMTHNRPDLIADQSNGDEACNAYYKTSEDVQLLKSLGVNFYRFSISWSRILPTGYANQVNELGIEYYNKLIDELKANDITPFVTMFHWDLPQPLQEIGGWPNPFLADIFADYADVLYREFGDRVRDWITFNEPMQICEQGYSIADKAPAYTQEGLGGYLCAHTLLIAHGKAYKVYNDKYRDAQQGRVGITIDTGISEPENHESLEDVELSLRSMQMNYGWYAHPIFSVDGDYPQIMKDRIRELSIRQGFLTSRLPEFTEEEINLIKQSSDFLGLNHYTSGLCTVVPEDWVFRSPSHAEDVSVRCYQPEEWEGALSSWLKVYPEGLRMLLVWIKEQYGDVEVIITENGFSDNGTLHDCRRINYYNSYLEEVLKAIHEDDVRVTGYTAWSFMDNFEWRMGYTEKFGLYHVDFDNEQKPRTPKMSAEVYKNIIREKKIDWTYTPDGFDECLWDEPEEESNEIS